MLNRIKRKCPMVTSTYRWSRAFRLTRGARRKPIIGNTGPSFGCTVKQIFNEIFFSPHCVMDDRQTDARTGRKREEEAGEGETRKKERLRARVKKKRGEFVTLIGDPGHAGRWPRDSSWTEGVRIQDSGTGINEREKYIGELAANEKNATSHVARGRKAASFFFSYKKGPRVRGATVRKKDRSIGERKQAAGEEKGAERTRESKSGGF